jgi:hypothetical protein
LHLPVESSVVGARLCLARTFESGLACSLSSEIYACASSLLPPFLCFPVWRGLGALPLV